MPLTLEFVTLVLYSLGCDLDHASISSWLTASFTFFILRPLVRASACPAPINFPCHGSDYLGMNVSLEAEIFIFAAEATEQQILISFSHF